MARRIPIVATLVVLAAVATMAWLGVWQLHRAAWKEALLARYAAAQGQPLLDGLPASARRDPDSVAFRRVTLRCTAQGRRVQIGGRNRLGATGYRQISPCTLPGGDTMMVDLGWLPPGRATPGADAAGPQRTGVLIPDPVLAGRVVAGIAGAIPLLLVSETTTPPLLPSVPPAVAEIPNNHRGYAVQWFLFAGVALIVYLLALRRRPG